MKITIVINGFYQPPSLLRQIDRLRNEVLKYSECDVADTCDLLALIDNARVKSDSKTLETVIKTRLDADAVIYLDKDPHIAAMFEKSGIKLFNSAQAISVSDDKMATHIALANSGIAMPRTVSAPLKYRGDDGGKFIGNLLKILDFPIVVKECHGSFGSQVYMAENYGELIAIRKNIGQKPHVYQEFIKSSSGRDVRMIVIGGKIAAAMERRNADGFKSNIEQGGVGRCLEIDKLDERFVKTAIKAAEIIGLDYAGVDLLYGDNGEPILCEINSNAYFNKICEVTGADIPAIYVKHIMRRLANDKKFA